MSQVANSCSTEIKQDLELSDASRPWRLLHINRGIVATRTHDPEIMRSAFDELLFHFPHEASQFFANGMKEMDAVSYPLHVRNLMEFYHSQKPMVSLH